MRRLTLAHLATFSAPALGVAAAEWDELSRGLDHAAEIFIRGTRDLEDVWPRGEASARARRRKSWLQPEIDNAYKAARNMAEALRDFQGRIRGLQERLSLLEAEAALANLSVDLTRCAVTPSDAPDARRIVNGLKQLRGELYDADQAAATAVRGNLPVPGRGFENIRARPVTEADLAKVLAGAHSVKGERGVAGVRKWWDHLTPVQQEQVLAEYPQKLGVLAGVPVGDRDFANGLLVDRHLDELRKQEHDLGARLRNAAAGSPDRQIVQDELATVQQHREDLEGMQRKLRSLGPDAALLYFDPADSGKAVVALGDPYTAKNTAIYVPERAGDLGGVGHHLDQVHNLQRAANAAVPHGSADVATVLWLGYDPPSGLGYPETDATSLLPQHAHPPLAPHDAIKAAGALRSFADGLPSEGHRVTAIGHGYAAAVVADAASGGRFTDVVLTGSTGVQAGDVGQLASQGHVWTGAAGPERVEQMTEEAFPTPPRSRGHDDQLNHFAAGGSGQDSYLGPGMTLDNQALIVTGQYGSVTAGSAKPLHIPE